MDPIDRLAETRIREAIERGGLTALPGEGKPLKLDDDQPLQLAIDEDYYRKLLDRLERRRRPG